MGVTLMIKRLLISVFILFVSLISFEIVSAQETITVMNATLPSGRFYLSCAEDSTTYKIYCFGGYDGNILDQIVKYDPSNDNLTIQNSILPTPRRRLSCAENSATNKIYCFGGIGGTSAGSQIVEYNPSSDTLLIKSATLPSPRHALSCAENSETHSIYCFGGIDSITNSYLNQIVEYNPSTDILVVKSATIPGGGEGISCSE
ncbi:MAG: hypothetical protein AABY07_03620, partial [Nanoarchaeota archaeon]